MNELGRNIKRVAMIPAVGFAAMCLLLGWWQVIRGPELRAHPNNSRAQERLNNIQPGAIFDSEGEAILEVEEGPDGWQATYPAGEATSHLTGYNNRSGLQWGLRSARLGIGKYESPWAEFIEGPLQGNDIHLTVDAEAQRLATRLMRREAGAVVALDARTGAILAMVSAPTYDPALVLQSEWDFQMFQEDPGKPEYNRALQGLYPPGSVMKIFTAAMTLDLQRVERETTFDCTGSYEIDGAKVTCPRAHGEVTLDEALQVSCNTTFARLGRYFTADELADYLQRFRLLERAAVPMPSSTGTIGEFTDANRQVLLAETAFGQGRTLVTPLAIARATLAIANSGMALEPFLVKSIASPSGRVIAAGRRNEVGRAVSEETARIVAGMMVNVVEEGTGGVASIRRLKVAGKTGSAENPHGQAHSWFTAFAPADNPQVVVTAVVENAGAGAETAGPIVREVMALLLSRSGAG